MNLNFNVNVPELSTVVSRLDHLISLGENFMADMADFTRIIEELQISVSTQIQQVVDLLTQGTANQAVVDDAVARLTAMNTALEADDPSPLNPILP